MQPVTLWSTFITISSTADTVILDLYTTHNDHSSLLSFFFIHNVHIPNSQISSVFHRITRKPFCVYVLFLVSRSIFHHTTQAIIEAPSKNYWKLHFSMKKTHPSLTTSRNDKHKLTNSLTHHIFTDKNLSVYTVYKYDYLCVFFFWVQFRPYQQIGKRLGGGGLELYPW